MAIGTITNPTTPIAIGTVATPTWASNVEDNINGLISGTGPTLFSLQIDGAGGAPSTIGGAHLGVTGGLSPGVAFGAAAGTSPSLAGLTGNDQRGVITITTGTTPSSGGTVLTVTFNIPFSAAPGVVILTPRNIAAATLSGASTCYAVIVNASSWNIINSGTALAGSTGYAWNYLVMG